MHKKATVCWYDVTKTLPAVIGCKFVADQNCGLGTPLHKYC